MDAIILCRVSDPRQTQADISLPSQEKVLRDYCNSRKLNVSEVFSFAESAYQDVRKKFDIVLSTAERHTKEHKQPVALVVWKIDRISRQARSKSIICWDDLRKAGLLVTHAVSDAQIFDQHANAMQNFTLNISLAVAQMHSDLGRERAIATQRWLIENGLYWDHAPIGMLNDRDNDNHATLVIDPERGKYIPRIFDLHLEGHNFETIAHMMREEGMTMLSGGLIYRKHIHRIIRQPLYAGYIRDPADSVLWPAHPKYPRLISKEIWDMAQDRKRKAYARTNRVYTFSAVVRCGECGSPVHPYNKIKPSGKEYVYLRCAKTKGACRQQPLAEKEAIAQVVAVLNQCQWTKEFEQAVLEEAERSVREKKQVSLLETRKLKDEIKRLEIQEKNLDEDRLNRVVDAQKYTELLTKLQERRKIVTKRLLQEEVSETEILSELKELLEACRNIASLFPSSPPEAQNDYLRNLVHELVLCGKTLKFDFKEGLESLFLLSNDTWWVERDRIKTFVDNYLALALA